MLSILYIVKEIHEFHMDFLEDQEKRLIFGKLVYEKVIVFELVLSEFKEITPEFETTFIEYEDFKESLKSDYEYSGECLDFYKRFLEFENNYPTDYNWVYQCAVVKYKLKNKENEPSLSEFKSYLDIFNSKNWVEEKGDELVIDNIPLSNENKLDNKSVGNNKIDQRFKEEKKLQKNLEF